LVEPTRVIVTSNLAHRQQKTNRLVAARRRRTFGHLALTMI
jgi:hypothetical protein